jgi:poly(A) polymerase
MTEREFAIDVVQRLRRAGFEAYWAGGCVRDELLGKTPADYDVATNATPDQVRPLFRRTVEVGVSFGVIEVIGPKHHEGDHLKIQIATFRSDGVYSDGRRPDSVTFSSAEEDAKRRDFTINGMFFDPLENRLIDFVGGQVDLQAKLLRAIGEPEARFEEDKLRMLRAVRMATRFELAIEERTAVAVRRMAPEINVVSAERIAEELRKLLVHPRRAEGMRLMESLELVRPIFPPPNDLLEAMKDLPQGRPHAPTGDLWSHVLRVLELLEGPTWPEVAPVSFPLAMAALLHDIGKKRTMGRTPERFTFHGHEHVGKQMADRICQRLKLSNEERTRIVWLVEKHQYLCDAPTMRLSKLKQILVHPGIGELLALHRADSLASGRSVEHVEFCESVLRKTPPEILNPPPILTGDDLIQRGLQAGPIFKKILDEIRDAQLEGKIKNKDEALQLMETVRELNEK